MKCNNSWRYGESERRFALGWSGLKSRLDRHS